MNTEKTIEGRCLCGVSGLKVKDISRKVGACHCGMCRRWSGGPLMAVDCGTEVTLIGEEHVKIYTSSDWAERGFCRECGTNLFYRLKGNGQYIASAGIFDLTDEYVFDHQIFIDEKPGFYDFSNETQNMTGAELFAMFSSQES